MLGTVLTEEQQGINHIIKNFPDRFKIIYIPPPGENYQVIKDTETGFCYLSAPDGLLLLVDGNGEPLLDTA